MFHIAAFYRFAPLDDFEALRGPLRSMCEANGVLGTILLAPEGVNGTIAGSNRQGVDAVLDHLRSDPRLSGIEAKYATADEPPFLRLKVRLKKEIVTLGVGPVDTVARTGTKVSPDEWNALIARKDVVLIDTRNDYEYAIGTFEGAINPMTDSFGDFPSWIDANTDGDRPTIAMFCTGGIRCEKASAWLTGRGFDDVYQLDGGILRYLETIPAEESTWEGECYVFDRRVTVGHGLEVGDTEVCVNCNRVVPPVERSLPGYEKGVTCPACVDTITGDRRSRFRERQHQITLAAERGVVHLGRSG
ncbi:MAG: rhodanese-related sulfurtransferase [Acidimicrobiia bacterium]|nr:rhodanese-related sulfurtransferase [Acidimicrobiia bacterium]